MDAFLQFIQTHKIYVDAAHAVSSAVNLLGWFLGSILLFAAWRRNAIRSVTVGPINFRHQEAAVEAAATAARDWQAHSPDTTVNVPEIRATVGRAFEPEIAHKLIGKSILWVDDNPQNNRLAVRALRKIQVEVEQETSTDAGLAVLSRRHFDLVISDMGRADNMRAGYDLLEAIRKQGNFVPFLIFAGADKPEFRLEAKQRGAQLSTNDMLELIDSVITELSA